MSDFSFTDASGEASNVAAAAVPASEGTAPAGDQENEAQEGQEGGPDEQKEPKTFTQEDVDRIAQKEREKGRRQALREQEQRQQEPQRPGTQPAPTRDQFPAGDAGDEEFWKAAVDHAADQKIAHREQQTHQAKVVDAYETRAEEARDKYPDFDAVAYEKTLKVTDLMADTIRESEIGPDLLYHLGKNPDESARIAALSPLQQVKELGKLEVKLTSNTTPPKKVSSAPEPIRPVPGTPSTTRKYGPDDPRSDSMSTEDWMAARRKQMSNR